MRLYLLFLHTARQHPEFYVRGFLQTRLRQAAWNGLAIILFSTLLQTSYHLYQGLLACLSLAPGFLILAIYFQASRRLYPVIVAHLISDLIAMLVLMKT